LHGGVQQAGTAYRLVSVIFIVKRCGAAETGTVCRKFTDELWTPRCSSRCYGIEGGERLRDASEPEQEAVLRWI
jgi:hypothetical protein